MNCGDWEERLALYAGGDLEAAGAAEVERHLAECPGCQVYASGLAESLALMREVHSEAIPLAHFAAVRARVLAQLETERRPWRQWAWACAVAAVVVAAVLASWPGKAPEPPRVALYHPPAPVSVTLLDSRGSVRKVRRRKQVAAHTERPVEALMVKLITDDPNVVIYWIGSTGGD